jgi:hypothetical protein
VSNWPICIMYNPVEFVYLMMVQSEPKLVADSVIYKNKFLCILPTKCLFGGI